MSEEVRGERGPGTFRFASFEVHVRSGVLLEHGERTPIQQLPFRMLVALLENNGQVVSQETLRERLWEKKTFADFDSGLRVAARKLRDALGDDASAPRFIRTVSGQGYQFIADFDRVAAEEPAPPPPVPPPVQVAAGNAHSLRAWWFGSALVLLALAAAASLWIYQSRKPLIGPDERVVIAGVVDDPAHQDLTRMLSSVLRLKLEEAPYLNVIPGAAFQHALANVKVPTQQDELQTCASFGGRAMLQGKVVPRDQQFRFLLRAWDCRTGKLLTTQSADADSANTLLSAVDTATRRMRLRLGESSASVEQFNAPIGRATTNSLAALKAFTQAEDKHTRGLETESIPDYKLAIALDPQFALAYAKLGTIYDNLGDFVNGHSYYQKAFDLRDRATDRERLYIASRYYFSVSGEMNNAIHAYEIWQSLYPKDVVPLNNLAVLYLNMGQPEKALPLAERAVHLDPNTDMLSGTLLGAYLATGNLQRSQQMCSDPKFKDTSLFWFHYFCYLTSYAQNNAAGMARQIAWSKGSPLESRMLDAEAKAAFDHGQFAEAQRLFKDAEQNATANGMHDVANQIELEMAELNAETGHAAEAKQETAHVLQDRPSAMDRAFAAEVYGRLGDASVANKLAAQVAEQEPDNTLLNSAVLPTMRAALALANHQPKQALQILEPVRPYDWNAAMEMASPYYRGLAFMQDNQPAKAEEEFRNLLAHRDFAPESPYVELAQTQLKQLTERK